MAKDFHEPAFMDDQTIFWGQNRYSNINTCLQYMQICIMTILFGDAKKYHIFTILVFQQAYILLGWDSTLSALFSHL